MLVKMSQEVVSYMKALPARACFDLRSILFPSPGSLLPDAISRPLNQLALTNRRWYLEPGERKKKDRGISPHLLQFGQDLWRGHFSSMVPVPARRPIMVLAPTEGPFPQVLANTTSFPGAGKHFLPSCSTSLGW